MPSLKKDIAAAVSLIDTYLDRAKELIELEKQKRPLPLDLAFHKDELEKLDLSLSTLAAKLLGKSTVDEKIWMPPCKYAFRNYDGQPSWDWLEKFFVGLRMSRDFFKSRLNTEAKSKAPKMQITIKHSEGFIIGDHGSVHGITVSKVFNTSDLPVIADQLDSLKQEMLKRAQTSEEIKSVAAVASAAEAAKAGDEKKMTSHLKTVGMWTFDTATKIGVALVAKIIADLIKPSQA